MQRTDAFDILDRGYRDNRPVAVVGMYSGGDDSMATMLTLEDWSRIRHVPFRVAHINTGIGIEETRIHVRAMALSRAWDFSEWRTDPSVYVRLVTGKWPGIPGGFPGKPMHKIYYGKLKDRRVGDIMRWCKLHTMRRDRVMLVSGIRQAESVIRMGYRDPINKYRAQVWVNPLFFASKSDCLDIIEAHHVPRNPVSATLHMSGECLCGAMAHRGELEEIRFWYPQTAAYLDHMTHVVRDAGFLWAWDESRPAYMTEIKNGQMSFLPLCTSCEARDG